MLSFFFDENLGIPRVKMVFLKLHTVIAGHPDVVFTGVGV